MVNACQQIGGSVGLALLSTVSASAASELRRDTRPGRRGSPPPPPLHGYTTAFWWACGIFAIGLLMAIVVLPAEGRSPANAASERRSPGGSRTHTISSPADGVPTTEPEPVGSRTEREPTLALRAVGAIRTGR